MAEIEFDIPAPSAPLTDPVRADLDQLAEAPVGASMLFPVEQAPKARAFAALLPGLVWAPEGEEGAYRFWRVE